MYEWQLKPNWALNSESLQTRAVLGQTSTVNVRSYLQKYQLYRTFVDISGSLDTDVLIVCSERLLMVIDVNNIYDIIIVYVVCMWNLTCVFTKDSERKKDSGIRNELLQKGHANRTAQKIYSTSDTAEIVRTYDITL